MGPISILLVGMAVVVGGVLALRLHAFLALIMGAIVVAVLTSPEDIYRSEVDPVAARVVEIEAENGVLFSQEKGRPLVEGPNVILRRAAAGQDYEVLGTRYLEKVRDDGTHQLVRLTARPGEAWPGSSPLAIEPGDLVLAETKEIAARKAARQTLGERIAVGFGKTCEGIGILVAMAAIVGACLLESGAAERVVVAFRRACGERFTPLAFMISGFTLAIPVFFDTVFLLLLPLGKALRAKTGKNYLLYVLSIVAGGTMAHSLVPPTPGPLFAAEALGVPMGVMMIGGGIVGLIASFAGLAYAAWANRRWDIPLRESAELSRADLEAMAHRDVATLPPLWLSLLPILLPVVLIAGQAMLEMRMSELAADETPAWMTGVRPWLDVVGNKNISMVLAAAIGLLMLAWHKRATRLQMAKSVQDALVSGGMIILITAAGGSFGRVLQQTNIATTIQEMVPAARAGMLLLLIAFGVTAIVRFAQGSATVAMITGVGIVGPVAAAFPLPYHPLYLALAVGCGSKPFPWMNDSGFWVISKMAGLTEVEALKTVSVMLTIMGIVGLAATLAGAVLFPLMP